MKTPALKPHPAAQLFPMMSDAEIDELAADIKEHGQSHPITTWQGSILDGRNRYEACRRAAVEPRLVDWVPHGGSQSPTQWVLSENLHRRHLTVDQRALIALEASTLFAQEAKARQRAAGGDRRSPHAPDRLPPRGGKRSEERAPTAAAQAAQTAGVSARSVERARRVQASQPEILSRVRDGSMTLKQAEKAVVQRERLKEVLAYQPPQGRYSVIVADPPWRYDDQLDGSDLARGGVQYPTMSVEEICAMKVGEALATPDCALWLWVTNSFIKEGYRVVSEWGFRDVGFLTWRKDRIGAGRYLRNQTEHVILAIKGRPLVNGESTPSIFDAPRRGHSEKPDEAFRIFEKATPAAAAARLELFARKPRDGWRTSGSELTSAQGVVPGVSKLTPAEAAAGRKAMFGDAPDYVKPVDQSPTIMESMADAEARPKTTDELFTPYQVLVEKVAVGPPHKARKEAARWAKEQGHRAFVVTDKDGYVVDVVDLPAHRTKAKKRLPPIVPGVTPFVGPFDVRVKGKRVGGPHPARDPAVRWAQEEGLREFSVTDSRGRACYSYQWSPSMGPPPKKKAPKKRAANSAKKPRAENAGAALHREHVERDLAAAAGRRLNGAGWKRTAAKAREEERTTTCHHCGTDDEDNDVRCGESDFELVPLCAGCRVRLRADPREFDRHKTAPAQVSLDEAIARAKPPRRPTKKFPLGTGAREPCTQCGSEQGKHDGTRCPTAKRKRAA